MSALPRIPGWTIETMHDELVQGLREDAVLYDSETEYQRLRLFENSRFGRVLTLDGVVQLTEADEFIYHEMMAHVPLIAHGRARRVLIIGGGDGGTAREVLRHPDIAHVTMVEIDPSVIDFAREFLPSVCGTAFDDPRLDLIIGDGVRFMAETEDRFDVILIDSTDPGGPSKMLFTPEFYAHTRERLTPGGIMVTQHGVPFLMEESLSAPMSAIRALFADATCYLAHVPSFSGGPMAFGWGALAPGLREQGEEVLRRRIARAGLVTRYYSAQMHRASFVLPAYVAQLLER